MNIVYPNLKRQLSKVGVSLSELSDILEIELVQLEKKMSGLTSWSLIDVVKICVFLNNPDVDFLFVQLDTNT